MRSKAVRSLTLALLLCGSSMSAAQQPGAQPGGNPAGSPETPPSQKQKAPPEKSKLEEMLAEALKNNPDIRVHAAKLAEAEAELNRTRLQVTQKVVLLHQAILSQKAVVDDAQKHFERVSSQHASAAVPQAVADQAKENLRVAKAKLEELEAQMPGLLGKTTRTEGSASDVRIAARLALEVIGQQPHPNALELYRLGLAEVVAKPHKATGPMAERLRKALQTPIKVDYSDKYFKAILLDLEKKAQGLSFRNLFDRGDRKNPNTYNLVFEEALPVAAVLQALADESGCLFLVRDYGLLVTKRGEGPPGALTVEEFLRQKPDSNEHKEAQQFIHEVWPTLKPESLEDNIPTAQKAFQTCMDVGDRDSIRILLGMTLGHVNRLQKRLSELHPELVIDDEKEAQQLKKVGEKLGKFGVDIQNCLKNWEQ